MQCVVALRALHSKPQAETTQRSTKKYPAIKKCLHTKTEQDEDSAGDADRWRARTLKAQSPAADDSKLTLESMLDTEQAKSFAHALAKL